MSKFYGIGVGPGDSSLLTIKAVNILKEIDILVTPNGKKNGESVAFNIVKEHLNEGIEIKERHFPMISDEKALNKAWDEIAEEIEEDVKSGKKVGFITLGDPMVYSTYIYLLKRLLKKIEVETIPGITSFLNIASSQNYPLVEGDNPLVIVPCTMDEDKLDEILKNNESLVLMKVYKNFKNIISKIKENNLEKYAVLVSNSSQNGEKVYKNVCNVSEDEISYFSTILINKGWGDFNE